MSFKDMTDEELLQLQKQALEENDVQLAFDIEEYWERREE